MSIPRRFMVNVYWGGNVSFENGFITGDEATRTTTIVMSHKMTYEDFVNMLYGYIGVERNSYKLSIFLCYSLQGFSHVVEIWGDESLETMYFLAEMDRDYWGQINVTTEPIQNSQQTHQTNPHQSQQTLPYHDTQPTIPYETQETFPYENRQAVPFENPTTSTNPTQHNDENQQTVFENSEECSSEHSEDTREAYSDRGSESEDEVAAGEPPVHNENPIFQQFYDEQAPMQEFAEEDVCDFWSKSENQIRLGMVFKNKEEVKHAIRMWSIAANREIYVTKSEPRLFHAVCYTRNTDQVPHIAGDPVCLWHVRAVKKINNNHWEIKRWVDTHNCYGSVQQNNNRCLTSRTISNHILHLIEQDIEYPVKNIRAFLKNSLNVDVSYPKA